jgi:hypothetical protein
VFAAHGRIGSGAAVAYIIGTGAAVHGVVAALPEQPVVVRASLQDIVATPAEQLVLALVAE